MNTPSPRKRDDAIDHDLESWLDKALASPPPADDLASRIVAATAPRLPRRRRTSVLAQIGLATPWRLAASLALVGLLAWATIITTTNDDPTRSPIVSPPQQVAFSDQEQRELIAAFAAAEGIDLHNWLDQQLALRDAATGSAGEADDGWSDAHDPMDALLDTFESEWFGPDTPRVF